MAPLDANERRDLACLDNPLDVAGRPSLLERIGVPLDHRLDELNLLQRVVKRRAFLRRLGRYIDAPELRPDAPFPQPRNIGVHLGLQLPNVALIERAVGFGPHLPRQIVVPVEHKALEVDLAAFLGKDYRRTSLPERSAS